MNSRTQRTCVTFLLAVAILLTAAAGEGLAQTTKMMPNRDALSGTKIVVWGNTTAAAGTTPCKFSFGDNKPDVTCTVVTGSRSYIAVEHVYETPLSQESFTATLTVGTSSAIVNIKVTNPTAAGLSTEQVQEIKTNLAIEDGLRYLYQSITNRETAFLANWNSVSWPSPGNTGSYASMALLAFENHGYGLTYDPPLDPVTHIDPPPVPATHIYAPVVQGGLNFLFNLLQATDLETATVHQCGGVSEPAGNPCVGLSTDPDVILTAPAAGSIGYSTAVVMLAIAGSGATQTWTATVGNATYVNGKSYLSIVQRLSNAIVYGQADSGNARGGWMYGLDNNASDGSAIGWNVLALFDAAAYGAIVPSHAKDELAYVIKNTTTTLGGLGYNTSAVPQTWGPNIAKTGVRLQALNFMGAALGATPPQGGLTAQTSVDYINTYWHSTLEENLNRPDCANGTLNKGCMYGMFNVFKGLKLYGINTLPNVNRNGNPNDDDWHKDYRDFLINMQIDPNTATGGRWDDDTVTTDGTPAFPTKRVGFSTHVASAPTGTTALALVILSPTALILPSNLTLSPPNAENLFGQNHTVTATATGGNNNPISSVTVTFEVLSGPSAPSGPVTLGTAVTGAGGTASITYTYNGPTAGTDVIRARIGNTVFSNTVNKKWKSPNNPPVAQVQNITLNANGDCKAFGSIDYGSFDPEDGTGAGVTITLSPPGPYGLGTTSVTLTITDSKGLSASATAIVTVVDVMPPTFTFVPNDVTAGQTQLNGATYALAQATATDNCGGVTVTPNPPPNFFPLGAGQLSTTTTVNWTATDNAGNTTGATTKVTVTNAPPVAIAKDVTVNADPVTCNAPANVNNGSNDPFGEAITITQSPAGPYPIGVTNVTLTVTDAAGQTSTATAKVTVRDVTPPKITVTPVKTTFEQATAAGTTVDASNFDVVTSDCQAVTLTVSVTFPKTFQLGTHTITWTATDPSGNSATASATIQVVDTTKPVITGALTGTTLWPPNHDIVSVGSIFVKDICDAAPAISMSITQDEPLNTTGDGNFQPDATVTFSGNTASIGLRRERRGNGDGRVYLLKLTATDASGNTSHSCSAVTVSQSQSKKDLDAVGAQAAAAVAACNASGTVLPYSSTVGPIVGPKQ